MSVVDTVLLTGWLAAYLITSSVSSKSVVDTVLLKGWLAAYLITSSSPSN
jgi:hypothetical protein